MSRNGHNSLLVHVRPDFMVFMTVFFGAIGLHDFIIKKWAMGLLHVSLLLTPLALALLRYNPLNLDHTVMPNVFFWTSYCWGILELHFYLKKIKSQTEPEVVVDYNTFMASNRVFLFVFAVITIVEALFLYMFSLAINTSLSGTHDGHSAVLGSVALMIILIVHGIVAFIAAIFFKYSYNLKCKPNSNMHYIISQKELKIFAVIGFLYRIIIKLSVVLNIGMFIISITVL